MDNQQWAYLHKGRLKNHDWWDWYQPSENAARASKSFMQPAMEAQHLGKLENLQVITFDGYNWIIGDVSLPSSYLDTAKYPVDTYSHDFVGRPARQFHGYMSNSAEFPEQIPSLDKTTLARLHEEKIIPLWNKSIEGEHLAHEAIAGTAKTKFESIPTVGIAEQLPKEAIAKLKEAHQGGKTIALFYDPVNKKWIEHSKFTRDIKGPEKAQAETSTKAASPSADSGSSQVKSDEPKASTNTAPENSKSSGAMMGALAAASMVGAGYAAFMGKKENEEGKPKPGSVFRKVLAVALGVAGVGLAVGAALGNPNEKNWVRRVGSGFGIKGAGQSI